MIRIRSRGARMAVGALKGWTSAQKHVVAASYLGWTLDAFDFFSWSLLLSGRGEKDLVLAGDDIALGADAHTRVASRGRFHFPGDLPIGSDGARC